MITKNLYLYNIEEGTLITPNPRNDTDEPYCCRLVAEENMALTDGTIICGCIDTHDTTQWVEIECPPEEEELEPEEEIETEPEESKEKKRPIPHK